MNSPTYGIRRKHVKPDNSWPVIDPGDMPHTISIEEQTTSVDVVGQTLQVWNPVLENVRAGVKAGNAGEQFIADGQQSQVTHLWTMNFPNNVVIEPGMRVNFQAAGTIHYYRIIFPENVQMLGVVLKLKCLELYGVSD